MYRPTPKSEYGQIVKYVRFLKQFPKATSILPGNFYAYFYMFNKDQEYSVIKFWDLMPLTFAYENYKSKDNVLLMRGLNMHHAPIRPRQIWLARSKKLMGEGFDDNSRLLKIAKWRTLYLMMKKLSMVSVRQYNMKNMVQVRQIPNDRIDEALLYYSRTYYGINIGRIEKDYMIFRI
jgi:hypothetical protein